MSTPTPIDPNAPKQPGRPDPSRDPSNPDRSNPDMPDQGNPDIPGRDPDDPNREQKSR